jgi:hypothetical protein
LEDGRRGRQRHTENRHEGPAACFPCEGGGGRAERTAKVHCAYEEGVEPAPGFWAQCVDEVLVGDERALYAEVEHDHTDNQSEDRCPNAEQQPATNDGSYTRQNVPYRYRAKVAIEISEGASADQELRGESAERNIRSMSDLPKIRLRIFIAGQRLDFRPPLCKAWNTEYSVLIRCQRHIEGDRR